MIGWRQGAVVWLLALVMTGLCGGCERQSDSSTPAESTATDIDSTDEQAEPILGLEKPPAEFDAASRTILESMCAYYKSLPAMALDLEFDNDRTLDGVRLRKVSSWTVAAARPNRLVIRPSGREIRGHVSDWTILSDDSGLHIHVRALDVVIQKPSVDSLSNVVRDPEISVLTKGVLDLIGFAMAADPWAALQDRLVRVSHLGASQIGEARVNRLSVETLYDKQIWSIDAGDQPLLREIEIDLSQTVADARSAGMGLSMRQIVRFEAWRTGEIPAQQLSVTLPEGVRRVESIFAMTAEDSIGESAPRFQLRNLAGEEIDAADYIGRHVILLDFWATWCAPCVASLPVLAEAAKRYDERGVKILAINYGEDEQVVREFLTEHGIDLPVLFDPDGLVAAAYGASGLPHSLIVDADGLIRSVHAGYAFTDAANLAQELDTVLRRSAPPPP